MTKICQCVQAFICLQINTATISPVAAIRSTVLNVFFTPETNATISSVSGFYYYEIQQLVSSDMQAVNDLIQKRLQSDVVLVNQLSTYIINNFLYSRSFEMMVDVNEMRVMEIMAQTTNIIAEGEVLQLLNVNDAETTEARYMEVIYSKTAKLFEAACQLGATLGSKTMKLSSSSIGALLFTAIGTTAFAFMAKRPAVDATAMQFGMTNSTTQTTSTNSTAPKEPESSPSDTSAVSDKTPVEEKENIAAEAAPATEKVEATTAQESKTDDTSSQEVIVDQTSSTTSKKITTPEVAPVAPAMIPSTPPVNTETTMPAPTEEALVESAQAPTESASVTPSAESPTPETPPVKQTEETQAQTAVSTDSPQTVETTPTEVATPAATQVPAAETTTTNAILTQDNVEKATTTEIESSVTTTTESASSKPKTITVRTDKLFGDSLPADLTNQLPETIEIPVDMLFDRSAPTEAAPK
ncbi:Octaprenyl diphosphate synthase [Nymphon striatum]|nr:Octaprenyl diphosphate synthase [Nymphon striatum]